MFSRVTDASKVAFVHLVKQLSRWGFVLIDCQIHSAHLESLGAETISRERFTQLLDRYCPVAGKPGPWYMDDTDSSLDLDTPDSKESRNR